MNPRLTLIVIACTVLSASGILLAKNLPLRRSVVISIPIATLENADYQIPPGTYRLGLHRWTKTGQLVPILQGVPGRSYILIHPGTRPEHSKGCILTSRENVERLVQLIKDYEEVSVIIAPAPQ